MLHIARGRGSGIVVAVVVVVTVVKSKCNGWYFSSSSALVVQLVLGSAVLLFDTICLLLPTSPYTWIFTSLIVGNLTLNVIVIEIVLLE